MSEKKRETWLDITKGIGIVLVVLFHTMSGIANSSDLPVPFSYYVVNKVISGFFMALFFFVSGMLIHSWTRKPFGKAIKEKIIGFVVPYFCWVLIVAVEKALTAGLQNNPITWEKIVLSPIEMFEEYWFLYIMFFVQLVYYAFSHFHLEKLFLVISAVLFWFRFSLPNVWIVWEFAHYAIFFATGTFLHPKDLKQFIWKYKWLILASSVVIQLLLWKLIVPAQNYIWEDRYLLVTACSGSLVTGLLSICLEKKSKFLRFFGQKSMEICCLHPTVLGGVRILIVKSNARRLFLAVYRYCYCIDLSNIVCAFQGMERNRSCLSDNLWQMEAAGEIVRLQLLNKQGSGCAVIMHF